MHIAYLLAFASNFFITSKSNLPTKPSKPNLLNHTYQTKPTRPSLPNQTYKTKPSKPNQTKPYQTKSYQTKPNHTAMIGGCRCSHSNTQTWVLGWLVSNRNAVFFETSKGDRDFHVTKCCENVTFMHYKL